jgi:hypothetical protein
MPRCFHCGLRVRFDVPDAHPGRGLVDHEPAAPPDDDGLPDLRLSHRLCHQVRVCCARSPENGVAARRAWLGWATERFDSARGFRARQCLRLGLHPASLPDRSVYRRHWRVRKMRYATIATRRY